MSRVERLTILRQVYHTHTHRAKTDMSENVRPFSLAWLKIHLNLFASHSLYLAFRCLSLSTNIIFNLGQIFLLNVKKGRLRVIQPETQRKTLVSERSESVRERTLFIMLEIEKIKSSVFFM